MVRSSAEATPGPSPTTVGAGHSRVRLTETMLALAPSRGEAAGPPGWVSAEDQARFVALLLGDDPRAAEAFVSALAATGVPRDVILRGLLLGAAGDIGAMWDRGECAFAELSVAAARLQGALEILDARARDW